MSANCVARFPLDLDLSLLSQAFHQQGIIHRFTEEQGEQWLWLANTAQLGLAKTLVDDFVAGELEVSSSAQPATSFNLARWLMRSPITWLLIALGGLGYASVAGPIAFLYESLTYTPVKVIGTKLLVEKWQWAEPWRVFTPVFLHFSIAHIVFNAAAMLQIGSWIERLWGLRFYALLCVISGVAGNVLQYSWSESPMFGGLSGIVFGLFTFNGVTQYLNPEKVFPLPKGMYIMLAVWLMAGFTPFIEQIFGVQMGNGAHLGGAVAGAILALVANRVALQQRLSPRS